MSDPAEKKPRGRPKTAGSETRSPSTSKGKHLDAHVGSRDRLRRTLLGMSQEKIGEALGLTFQQVQKYERGANRISASRLFDLGRVLDVPISFFFDDINSGTVQERQAAIDETADLSRSEILELAKAFYRIEPASVRRKVLDLVKAVEGVEA